MKQVTSHPLHSFFDSGPDLLSGPFHNLQPRISGYRQVSDATLMHFARWHQAKLVTFDQGLLALSPWSSNIEVVAVGPTRGAGP